MTKGYYELGVAFKEVTPELLQYDETKLMLRACILNKDYEVLELRRVEQDGEVVQEIIVVDCENVGIPTRNDVGILMRERLALVFRPNSEVGPEVRLLRTDFPAVPHLNHVKLGEPAWMCLYFEPWSAVVRSWTPQRHLQRILWWLLESSKKSLHRPDQPVEQIYFVPSYKVILPPDFHTEMELRGATLDIYPQGEVNGVQYARAFYKKNKIDNKKPPEVIPITVNLPPIIHGGVEYCPLNLGQLNDQLGSRNCPVYDVLNDAVFNYVQKYADGGFVTKQDGTFCLLIFRIPIVRKAGRDPERTEVRGFLTSCDLATLGDDLGALEKLEVGPKNQYYAIRPIGLQKSPPTAWRDIVLLPAEVKTGISRSFAREASGVLEAESNFKGFLAGVGALGGVLANLWAKEGWGDWSLADPDVLEPHNIVRHIGVDVEIGQSKAVIAKDLVESNYYGGYWSVNAFPTKFSLDRSNPIGKSVEEADFLVDATTTLNVPRDLAQCDNAPRSTSVFVTPSGIGSVMLMEDSERIFRLDSLEAQYYRSIINSSWGEDHLVSHYGYIGVGMGCRDISGVMSFESITLHAAIIAQQVRIHKNLLEPVVKVWDYSYDSGSVTTHRGDVAPPFVSRCGEWEVVTDEYVLNKLKEWRLARHPKETGGIILGYPDHVLGKLFVVDVLSAPADSKEEYCSFIRGVQGLQDVLEEVSKRTANVVDYIGEWHSHPPGCTAYPSTDDKKLIAHLSHHLSQEGQPALMLIVGEDGVSFVVGEEGGR